MIYKKFILLNKANYVDLVNDQVKIELSDFDLSIIRVISKNPGSNSKKIYEELSKLYSNVTIDMVRNSLKRKLHEVCEFRGTYRNDGYYLKD